MLEEQAFIIHISTHPLGAVSSQPVRAMFSERQDGLVNDFNGLSDLILLDHKWWSQADDVAVRGLGQEPVIAEPQTHLPGIVVCNGREGKQQQDFEGICSTAEEVPHLQHVVLFASWQRHDAGCSQRERSLSSPESALSDTAPKLPFASQVCLSTQSSAPAQLSACLALS